MTTALKRYEFIERYCSIASYKMSLEHFGLDGNIRWDRLSAGDQLLKGEYLELSPAQQRLFRKLVGYLRHYVTDRIGIESFDQPTAYGIWNWPTWVRVLLKIAASVQRNIDDADGNCWSSDYAVATVYRRPAVNIRPGHIELRLNRDSKKTPKTRRVMFVIDPAVEDPRFKQPISRLMAVLFHGIPSPADQASHLCHNVPQNCINPNHLCWEKDQANKSRNRCVNGAAFYCPHEPKCIYTSLTGRYLPHRNGTRWEECTCTENCHTARIAEDFTEEKDKAVIAVKVKAGKKRKRGEDVADIGSDSVEWLRHLQSSDNGSWPDWLLYACELFNVN
jgi:hypothetical protein